MSEVPLYAPPWGIALFWAVATREVMRIVHSVQGYLAHKKPPLGPPQEPRVPRSEETTSPWDPTGGPCLEAPMSVLGAIFYGRGTSVRRWAGVASQQSPTNCPLGPTIKADETPGPRSESFRAGGGGGPALRGWALVQFPDEQEHAGVDVQIQPFIHSFIYTLSSLAHDSARSAMVTKPPVHTHTHTTIETA